MSKVIYSAHELVIDNKKVEGVRFIDLSFNRALQVILEYGDFKGTYKRIFKKVRTEVDGTNARIILGDGESHIFLVNDYGVKVDD